MLWRVTVVGFTIRPAAGLDSFLVGTPDSSVQASHHFCDISVRKDADRYGGHQSTPVLPTLRGPLSATTRARVQLAALHTVSCELLAMLQRTSSHWTLMLLDSYTGLKY